MPIFSTAYLPPILYVATAAKYGTIAIERYETFPKQTFRNRAAIATASGVEILSVPVIRTNGNHTTTNDILVSYHEPWHIRHWRAIVSAYNTSPFFLYYRDPLEEILNTRFNRLIDLNDALMIYIFKSLKIDCEVHYTEDYLPEDPSNPTFRTSLTNKKALQTAPLLPSYYQVFEQKNGFIPNLSIIDLIFNLGPEAKGYLCCI